METKRAKDSKVNFMVERVVWSCKRWEIRVMCKELVCSSAVYKYQYL
jgi:hypothetical protein